LASRWQAERSAEREEVGLSGVRAEFRIALRQEIDAARRSASGNAVGLVNGRRIAQIGGGYQYVFTIENALNLPGDMPGELRLPDRAPVDVTVISLEGLTVTLSVPDDLGAFVPAARLVTDLTFLMRKLIERIETLGDGPNPAGERIRGALPVAGVPVDVAPFGLNAEQTAAVASSLGRNATFIWGPPGTGKTRTIGAIVEELYRRDRSVLLVSHTNAAVDQALLRVGAAITSVELAEGQVVRVGVPVDQRFSADENRDLLLVTHVERRSAELSQRRDALQAERESATAEVLRVSRLIDVREWVDEAGADLTAMNEDLSRLHSAEAELERARATEHRLASESQWWADAARAAGQASKQIAARAAAEAEVALTEGRLTPLSEELATTVDQLQEAENLLARAQSVEPLRVRARSLPPLDVQTRKAERDRGRLAEAERDLADTSVRLAEAEALHANTSSRGRLARMWRHLPDPEVQGKVVERLRIERDLADRQREQCVLSLQSSERLLAEVAQLAHQLWPHSQVPELADQMRVVRDIGDGTAQLRSESERLAAALDAARARVAALSGEIEAFERQYAGSPEEILHGADAHARSSDDARALVRALASQSQESRQQLEGILRDRLSILREWRLCGETNGTAEAMTHSVEQAYATAVREVDGFTGDELRTERDCLNARITAIDVEVHQITEALKRVEENIIAQAKVVATTLTRAYLRDSIQSRRFDTVVLDEASIAPIPALWVAASLADASAVVVGDPRQLPPIVMSRHPMALKWLGRDIFDHAGVSDRGTHIEHRVELNWQYRMHPDISAVPNALIYEGRLRDDDTCLDDGDLHEWYAGHDHQVLLVDTGPLDAWVTSVPRGESASRLNFLSATICVDIAHQLLHDERPPKKPGGTHRIIIVCPYRAHAALVQLLLRERQMDEEVLAGTAHHFQGSEAGVVIFDLVNDEPHWRVAMFNPEHDASSIPLLNVALTRAQRRLILVGDFDYIAKNAKRAFIGARMLPFLQAQAYPRVSALDVVPVGLAARAARAQMTVLGGEVEPGAARQVVNQDDFYRMLADDLLGARSQVVIYSAFITRNRLGMLEPQLRAAVDRGVKVYVVTKDYTDRRKSELAEYRLFERTLKHWGVVVVRKRGMHEKLVFIDGEILWSGSLNPLSHSDTQEIMERRVSRDVISDFAQKLRLGDLIAEYRDGPPICPSGHELIATEGNRDPFYWRCVQDGCYTRDIDEPRPEGGMIWCSNSMCGGPVEYGEWGGKAAWRCLRDRHHHRKVMRSHLRLPKMRELVPKHELRRLDKALGTGSPPASPLDAEGGSQLGFGNL